MATLAFAQQAHLAAQGDKARANLLDRGTIVLAEVGDGFVIRNEPPGQPHHFQIAASLTLQPPARLDPVEIAVDVKLEHRRRMIGRPAGRCRIDTVKPEVAEFQRIDEHIDRPNRIALVDPILKAFWQQRRLPAIQSRHKAWHQIPRRFSRGSWHKKSFHTAWTQCGRSSFLLLLHSDQQNVGVAYGPLGATRRVVYGPHATVLRQAMEARRHRESEMIPWRETT